MEQCALSASDADWTVVETLSASGEHSDTALSSHKQQEQEPLPSASPAPARDAGAKKRYTATLEEHLTLGPRSSRAHQPTDPTMAASSTNSSSDGDDSDSDNEAPGGVSALHTAKLTITETDTMSPSTPMTSALAKGEGGQPSFTATTSSNFASSTSEQQPAPSSPPPPPSSSSSSLYSVKNYSWMLLSAPFSLISSVVGGVFSLFQPALATTTLHTDSPLVGVTPSMALVPRATQETQPVSAKVTSGPSVLDSAKPKVRLGIDTAPINGAIAMKFSDVLPHLATGDVILFHGMHSVFSETVEMGSWSQFSHVGMVLSPPHFLGLEGDAASSILMFESGWDTVADVEDKKVKFGVSMVPFNSDYVKQYTGKVFVRRLMDSATRESFGVVRHDELNKSLAAIHELVHNKPYDTDPMDFIRAELKLHYGNTKRTDMFFCSSFLAFVYYELNLIEMTKANGWVLYAPKDFSTEVNTVIGFKDVAYLEKEILLLPDD